jgi:hypothetical protein
LLALKAAPSYQNGTAGLGGAGSTMTLRGREVLIEVVEDTTMMVRGFEHQTFKCPVCNEIDQRHTFKKQGTEQETEASGAGRRSARCDTRRYWSRAKLRLSPDEHRVSLVPLT